MLRGGGAGMLTGQMLTLEKLARALKLCTLNLTSGLNVASSNVALDLKLAAMKQAGPSKTAPE